jgi:hypothetical protein
MVIAGLYGGLRAGMVWFYAIGFASPGVLLSGIIERLNRGKNIPPECFKLKGRGWMKVVHPENQARPCLHG